VSEEVKEAFESFELALLLTGVVITAGPRVGLTGGVTTCTNISLGCVLGV